LRGQPGAKRLPEAGRQVDCLAAIPISQGGKFMAANSRWLAVCSLLLGIIVQEPSAQEPKPAMRPITDAESILAVYREDWGLYSRGEPTIIFSAWPDGSIIWSGDRLMGGPPYRAGHIDPKRVTAFLSRLEKDGFFADAKLNDANFGPDSQFTTMFIKSGKKQVKMCSWHELMEDSDTLVVDNHGAAILNGRRRLDELRKAPAHYLFYRFVWSETRSRLADLVPAESTATGGKPVMKAGKLSWQEPAATRALRP
jgi:hypothetical protein